MDSADIGRKVVLLEIDADQAGQRVDNFLAARLKGVPRSRIYRLLRKGEVRVNKKRIKPEYKLAAADVVRIPPVTLKEQAPQAAVSQSMGRLLENSILLELPGLLVVNKPAGLAVHGGSGVNLGLIESLRQLRPNDRYLELVHRLDRDTSGCILIARKRSMLRYLQEELRQRRNIQKFYQALVIGQWSKRKQYVDAPLLRIEVAGGNRIVKVSPEGKASRTEFKVLRRFDGFSLIQAKPVTGRTHQIRVHAQSQGHALLGDEKYGDDELNLQMRKQGFKRLFLHAAALQFTLPDEEQPRLVEAPLWPDLAEPLAKLQEIPL
ncbi:23S rRNA pseudouridine(955/2504/2580) synthase RluC [uncultured Pseudoteredinibacter sp.]|uniref:23S rRNA pseudouridine(955/2504/2580) synthase RluC n=1 Tax=uncultured Pseudoteredinibacter sp. TaxID=1641701 RepID=UPI002616EB54|nr:23S rRNA pseudouridine(955/2504/2580) synthase RluC [uncultured Pseudoteredinibacter sp.]